MATKAPEEKNKKKVNFSEPACELSGARSAGPQIRRARPKAKQGRGQAACAAGAPESVSAEFFCFGKRVSYFVSDFFVRGRRVSDCISEEFKLWGSAAVGPYDLCVAP